MKTLRTPGRPRLRYEPVTIEFVRFNEFRYFRIAINNYFEMYSTKQYKEMKEVYFKAYHHLNK